MGMSTKIKAFMPDTDSTYQKMKKVYDACNEADIPLPKEVQEYLGDADSMEERLEVKLKLGKHYDEWSADMQEGFEVDLTKLPEGVTKLRFYNSW